MQRIALYPGTFDPVTHGHLDIVRRAIKLVDRLVIGVTTNPSKSTWFSTEEREALISQECASISGPGVAEITVETFDTLLIKYAEQIGAQMIVRGLRAVSDFEY